MTDTRTMIDRAEGTKDDKMFEGALNSILHMDKKDYPSYVSGLMVASGHDFTVSSPIDESIRFGQFQDPEEGIADTAVGAAREALNVWVPLDPKKRTEMFEKAADTIRKQRYRLAAAVTISSGMIRRQSLKEVDDLIEFMERDIKNAGSKAGNGPGVWAVVSEHNSPLFRPISVAIGLMLGGSTVILLPSRYAPIPVYMIYDILRELPPGVFNVITERGGRVTGALMDDERVNGIAAIGSGERTEDMMFMQIDGSRSFVNMMKGMNPILVSAPPNMDDTARYVLENAFAHNGQCIDACSKVIVIANDQKAFMDAVLKAVRKLNVGDPANIGTDIGPVISKESMIEFLRIADDLKDNIIFGGKRIMNEETEFGYYVLPMILTGLPRDHEFNNIDHGLPILSVQTANDCEDALEMMNECEFGMTSRIYTKDEGLIKKFGTVSQSARKYANGREL